MQVKVKARSLVNNLSPLGGGTDRVEFLQEAVRFARTRVARTSFTRRVVNPGE